MSTVDGHSEHHIWSYLLLCTNAVHLFFHANLHCITRQRQHNYDNRKSRYDVYCNELSTFSTLQRCANSFFIIHTANEKLWLTGRHENHIK